MGSFELSPSHRGSETTSCAARWHDDALAKTDAWQGGPIRRSMKTAAFTPPFSLIMNRIWPRAVIAEIRLMRWRAPVVSTMGVSPLLPHVRPA